MRSLDVSEAYRIWAPTYSGETAISFLEDKLVRAMTPPLHSLRLLDVGCGTGRRLRDSGAATTVGLEPCAEMIAAGSKSGAFGDVDLVVGDVRSMPLPDCAFDVIWCRLVLGHLPELGQAYRELARVADQGAVVIVTDFHPSATQAGHRRSFRAGGEEIEVEHYLYQSNDHLEAAQAAGLVLKEIGEAEIGSDVRSFYEQAGRLDTYGDHVGLAVVLVLSFRRER